jgi:cation-transporting ATPase 13A2
MRACSQVGTFRLISIFISPDNLCVGESVPESKVPATDAALEVLNLKATSIHPSLAKHFLFCGTKIIRVRRPHDDDDDAVALAMVMRTGFATTKGSLMRSMLFPKPSGFKLYRDAFRYISVMGMIAVLGFVASFVNFIRLGVSLDSSHAGTSANSCTKLSWRTVIVRALDLITIVVPPALPATLTIGTNFALGRLKKRSIFCISPQRYHLYPFITVHTAN